MMLTWIGYAMLCTAALGALAGGIERVLRRQRYPRRVLWIAVMLASAGVPIGASLVAKPRIVPNRGGVAVATEFDTSGGARTGERLNTDRVVQTVWATASLCAALWLGILQLRLTRRLRRCAHADIAGRLALVSPDFGPAVVGVFHPEIVLPEWALALDAADRRLVVAHETEHTRARDPALHLAGVAVAVLFPWNPGLWWQLKRLRLAIEIDCDARVVARYGQDPVRYGELLLTAHSHAMRPIVAALALVQRRSALGQRIDALVTLHRHSVARVLTAVGVGLGSVAVVAFAPAPSLRDPIVVFRASNILNRADTALTQGVSPATVNQGAVAVARRPRSTPAARRTATIESPPLPPIQLTPTRFDSEVTRLAAPAGAAALPRGRLTGRARGGFVMAARPGNGVAPTIRADTALRRGGMARVVQQDTIRPPR